MESGRRRDQERKPSVLSASERAGSPFSSEKKKVKN